MNEPEHTLSPAAASNISRPMTPTTVAWLIALLGWTTLLCFYNLAGGAKLEPIDCWVAQTAREMTEADDWLIPRFSGEVRMQKSPGPYWAVMLTSLIRGTPIDETSARIPNTIAAILLVFTVFWLTRRIAGDRAAIFAGFAASASVLVLWWSHRAASDLGLASLTTLSLAAIWIASESEPPGRKQICLWMLGYFAAGLGMLYKMPMPLAVIGLPALFYLLLRNRWRILANRWHLLGFLLFLLPWLPWVVGVLLTEDAALTKWKVEFIDRFTGDLPNVEGQDNWKYLFTYLAPPLLYCLPFTLSLPTALVRAFRKQPGVNRNGTLFMFIWFASLLFFFTASTGKEWRYFLPALPPLFVLLGIELSRFFDPSRRTNPLLDRAGAIAVWILLPAGLVAVGVYGLREWWQARGRSELQNLYSWNDVWQAYAVVAVILAFGFGLAAWLYLRRRKNAAFALMVATMWGMWLWGWPNIMPILMSQRPFIDFAQQIRDKVPAESYANVLYVGSQDSRIIWYGDFRFPRAIDQLELLEEQGGQRSLDYEIRRYGEEMVKHLESDEQVLMVAALFNDYLMFINEAPRELAKSGRSMPPVHLWLQSQYGREDRHFVLFGNRPPPYPEPELWLSEDVRRILVEKGLKTRPPVALQTSQPAGGG